MGGKPAERSSNLDADFGSRTVLIWALMRATRGNYSFGMQKLGLVVLTAAVFSWSGFAQKSNATGSVSGRVTCADTNTPARLAVVLLRPVPASKDVGTATASRKDSTATPRTVEARSVQTTLDGSFSIPNVAPGTYLVLASLPGYISPLANLGATNDDLLEATKELRKKLLETLPTVTVENSGAAFINVSLERAAAVSGTILFDDGSPASGVEVKLREKKHGKWVPHDNFSGDGMSSGNALTDDRGNFRITGLPGIEEAVVEADLSIQNRTLTFSKFSSGSSSGPGFILSFFSGDAVREKDARPFRLTIGEERRGEDISIPLSKLHRIHGSLVAKTDGHALNDGTVSLLFAGDHTEVGMSVIERGTESFEFPFVPEGEYVLRVGFAADALFEDVQNQPGFTPAFETRKTVLRTYAFTEVPLHVDGDRNDLTVAVPANAMNSRSAGQQ